MKKINKAVAICLIGLILALSFTSCSTTGSKSAFDTNKDILVISREEGSGTRGAFIELLKIQIKNADGTKKDRTTTEAIIANKTDLILTQVSGNDYAIGYISLGSLNDKVKAVKVDGISATTDNVKNGTYKISRPFIIATKGEATGLKKDFISYVVSKQGQDVIYVNKYIKINETATDYKSSNLTGKLVIAGSSSVTPVMEKLKEAYKVLNPNITVEVQQSDSTTGIQAAISNTCDIAMSSRDLTTTETLVGTKICLDGIAIIFNKNNPLENILSTDITKIYIGEVTKWNSLSK